VGITALGDSLVTSIHASLIVSTVSTSQPSFVLASSLPRLGNDPTTPAELHIGQEQTEQLKDAAQPIPIHLPQPQKLPKDLPKDRPFANIVEVRHTTAAPQHLQRIMDLKGSKPADKSAKLKAALLRDNQALIAYCALLLGELVRSCAVPAGF
jgi:hypothetical protein